MSELLRELSGQRVKAWSESGQASYSDEGVLEAFDGTWLRLRSDEGELLYFTVYNVRLVKRLPR